MFQKQVVNRNLRCTSQYYEAADW